MANNLLTKLVDKAHRLCHSLNSDGSEAPDPQPMFVASGLKKPETLQQQIRRMIRNEASLYAMEHGSESFEEADDFDIGDDFDPESPYELEFDQENFTAERPQPSADQRSLQDPAIMHEERPAKVEGEVKPPAEVKPV